MIRFKIKATDRAGLKGVWRAGRFFPSSDHVLVEVHDQAEDPPSKDPTKPPFIVGQKSWKAIEADNRLRIVPDGDILKGETAAVQNLRARFDQAWANQKAAHAAELARLEEKLAEAGKHAEKLEAELVEAFDKIASLQAALEQKAAEPEAHAADEQPTKKAKKAAGA